MLRGVRARSITDAIEQHLIPELIGAVVGARVLDAGCGDGALACAAAVAWLSDHFGAAFIALQAVSAGEMAEGITIPAQPSRT
jgi:hypothetical protein